MGPPDGSDVGYERRRGFRVNPRAFILRKGKVHGSTFN